ncbi:ankyrin repeat domain-containing protein 40-like [Diorhabda carinulata]|uniref:ankyrin repeat domain-containing protein 40-like n=1 Tax=Diorhabda carinulata TaxID=1163345 RepID=UPI0025A1C88D|nr:ankyrin repeat domain-containing protein 40-like [Diorhabda carinulata]
MSGILEEKLREAASIGDTERVTMLLSQNVDVNSQNSVNGWTALHWAYKRGNENIIKLLNDHGANPDIKNFKGQTPNDLCPNLNTSNDTSDYGSKFIPNYLKNPPLQIDLELGNRMRKGSDFANMPITPLPVLQNDDLVLKVRVHGSSDPDFIEIEIPRWKLTYSHLMNVCCQELEILDSQVERIRKLPNTRLRKDSDVKRLRDYQALEVVIKSPLNGDKMTNCYPSISTKNQTILY